MLAAIAYRLVPVESCRRVLRVSFPLLDAVVTARFVADVWGGDSFSDIYGLGRMVKRAFGSVLTIVLGARLVLLPQTYGPYDSWISRLIALQIIKRVDIVMSRHLDEQTISRLGIRESINPVFCPDVAFTLRPSCTGRNQAAFDWLRRERWAVGINVNGLLYSGGYTRDNMFGLELDYPSLIRRITTWVLNELHRPVVFVPHTYEACRLGHFENDLGAALAVVHDLDVSARPDCMVVTDEMDHRELKALIGQVGFFAGSRLHSCIAALSQGVPTAGIAYSDKFLGVFSSIGLSKLVIDARSVDTREALARFKQLVAEHHTVRDEVVSATASAKKTIVQTFSHLPQWLGLERLSEFDPLHTKW